MVISRLFDLRNIDMPISQQQKKQFRQQAHHLKPVVMLGSKGLTDAVQMEIDNALETHELIKIKIAGDDRDARNTISTEICSYQHAELIQTIGKTITVYRQRSEKE